jgi:hypothetical protein
LKVIKHHLKGIKIKRLCGETERLENRGFGVRFMAPEGIFTNLLLPSQSDIKLSAESDQAFA